MNDIEAEYGMGLEMLGFPGMVYFKFLSTFSIKISKDETPSSVTFGAITDANVSRETAETLRTYLKHQKEWVKSSPTKSVKELRQRMWWVVQKVIDLKLFNEYGHRYIMFWHDSCDDQLLP